MSLIYYILKHKVKSDQGPPLEAKTGLDLQSLKMKWICTDNLLFISYKVVKGFLVVNFFLTCYFLLKLSWCVSTFFIQPETKFQLDPTKNKKFPDRSPIHDVTKVGNFYNGGYMGKCLIFSRIKLKFRF